MNFTRKAKIQKEDNILAEQYPHVLLLYKSPPDGEITLTEFQEYAFERVQVLRILEQGVQMGHKLYSAEWKAYVLNYLRKQNLKRYVRLIDNSGCSVDSDYQIRREDHISHFILRLAYCRSHELRNWFIARELEFFRLRFSFLSTAGVKKFIETNNLKYFPISNEEKDRVKNGLVQSTYGHSLAQVETSDFYKVPFKEVLNLVRNTSVYLSKGYAYIPIEELVSCVASWFRATLNEALAFASKRFPTLDDDRITKLVSTLPLSYTGKDYSNVHTSNSSLHCEALPVVARKSFPLCMRNLYDVLKSTHHLKHFGRLQFGLFLKGIGLSLDEALRFWREEFTKIMDPEKFNKEHVYNIKHSYGALGKMTSYAPYGCRKIISSNPGSGEHHGCPFKLWDAETLKHKLQEYGLSSDGVKEVTEAATKGNYQIACSKYFLYTHGGQESKQVIYHPNQYYEESQDLLSDDKSGKKRKYAESSQSYSTQTQTQTQNQTQTQTQNQTQTQTSSQDALLDDDFDLSLVTETPMDV